jgi:anion transporter
MPTPTGLSLKGQQTLAIILWMIVFLVFEIEHPIVAGTVMLTLFMIFEVASSTAIFSGFASSPTWLFFGGMVVAAAWLKTGLGKRFAHFVISKIGSKLSYLCIAICIIGLFLTIVIPSVIGRTVLLISIVIGLLDILNQKKNSSSAIILLMCVYISITFNDFFVWSDIGNIFAMDIYQNFPATSISSYDFTYLMFPSEFLGFIISLIILVLIARSSILDKKLLKKLNHKDLSSNGPMSQNEKFLSIFTLFAILLFALEPFHGINPAWIMVLIAGLLFLFRILGSEDLEKINLPLIIFGAAMISIGAVASESGLADWLVQVVSSILGGVSGLSAVYSFASIGFLLSLFTSNFFGLSVLGVPFMEYAQSIGLHPFIALITLKEGFNMPILFFTHPVPLLIYATGLINLKDLVKYFILFAVIRAMIFPVLYFWMSMIL